MLLAVVGAIGFFLACIGVPMMRPSDAAVAGRLARLRASKLSVDDLELNQPFGERVLRPFIRKLADGLRRAQQRRSGRTRTPRDGGLESTRHKLALAGNPYGWTAVDFLGTKAFAALVIGGVLFFLMTIGGKAGHGALLGTVGALIGWFGPDLLVRSKTRARQKSIQRALPDALDLLVVSVEAGLGFDGAIQRLVEHRTDALATEFARVLAEMRVGRSRRDAFKDMLLRTQVADLNIFVGAILQAELLGVSVSRVLTVQSEQMRIIRRQRAEEKAAQLQLKLIFPLAIFVFPALCVVVLGPIWPTLASTSAPGI
jgi:tight adherence protein C